MKNFKQFLEDVSAQSRKQTFFHIIENSIKENIKISSSRTPHGYGNITRILDIKTKLSQRLNSENLPSNLFDVDIFLSYEFNFKENLRLKRGYAISNKYSARKVMEFINQGIASTPANLVSQNLGYNLTKYLKKYNLTSRSNFEFVDKPRKIFLNVDPNRKFSDAQTNYYKKNPHMTPLGDKLEETCNIRGTIEFLEDEVYSYYFPKPELKQPTPTLQQRREKYDFKPYIPQNNPFA